MSGPETVFYFLFFIFCLGRKLIMTVLSCKASKMFTAVKMVPLLLRRTRATGGPSSREAAAVEAQIFPVHAFMYVSAPRKSDI